MSKSRDIADSAATINYIDTVTSNVQSQIDNIDALPSQSGNAGKFLTTDGTTDSWGEVSASPTLEAVASGTLANGDTVIINADGTVTAAGLVSTPVPVIGSTVEFEAGNTSYISSCYDTGSNKVIIAYRDGSDSNSGDVVVGTVANGAITFGSPVPLSDNNNQVMFQSIAYDANANKVVVIYHKNAFNYGRAQVGTVSGTSISLGAECEFWGAEIGYNAICYDSSANKLIIAWYAPDDTAIKVKVGTISGTSISFGSVATTAAPTNQPIGLVYDANANKSLLCFRGASDYGYAAVISVSGTTASIGTPAPFVSETVSDVIAVYDSSNNKTLIVWRKTGNNYGAGIVATISGTSVTFGTEAVIASETFFASGASFDTTVNKTIVAYYNNTSGYGKSIQSTISGTGVTSTSPVTFLTASPQFNSPVYDSDSERTIFAFKDLGNSNKGTSLLYSSTTSTTNLTTENYIGISDAAYSNGATATIQLVGTVDDAQTSLTAGQSYFVQDNGSIALTPATTPVFAGTAVSATKLLIGERNELPYQTGNSGKFLTTNGTVASWGSAGVTSTANVSVSGGFQYTVTGIPSTATHIWINIRNFQGPSGRTYIRLGTSGGIVNSGYSSSAAWLRSGPDIDSETVTDSLPFFKTDGSNRICSGVVHLSKQATNTWVMNFVGGGNPVANLYLGGGSSGTLSGVLTQFQIENDVGNFTGGTFNVSYM